MTNREKLLTLWRSCNDETLMEEFKEVDADLIVLNLIKRCMNEKNGIDFTQMSESEYKLFKDWKEKNE